ncbi:MAG: HAD-IB family hydrolase [Actinobacteria bacterium]|nr:HAD-IB family hydrolase [Actinomycetota bacterium]
MPKRIAFFDVDRTLIPGSSLFLLARGAYARDFFRVRDILRFGYGQVLFRLRGEHAGGIDRTRDSTLDFVIGRSQAELVEMGNEIVEERILPRVYPDIFRVIEQHREEGDLTYLVTAAPIELASSIAIALDMDGAVGTESELDAGGYYTGRLVGAIMHGPEKAKAAAEVAEVAGIDLADCLAYSDSISDLPLLESVGYPHAVNPEHELRRLAMQRGWPIHELRTRRRLLLVGIPAGLGGAGLFAGGVALGVGLERRNHRRRRNVIERIGRRWRSGR